ncbi:MAG: glycosyltransferase family 2 protein [Acidobacteriota bacterium]
MSLAEAAPSAAHPPSRPPRDDLSVVVLTQDAAETLAATLDAASRVSRDLHVVDSGSRDDTVRIAERSGARVVHRPFRSYHDQRNWAIRELPIRGAWELHLDASEVLSEALIREILALDPKRAGYEAFLLPRLEVFLGREIRHGGRWPSWQLRLFRRGAARVEARPYDQHFVCDGPTGRLHGELVDQVATSVDEWKQRHLRWAALEAQSRRERVGEALEPAWRGDPRQRRRAWRGVYYRLPPLLRPLLWFLLRAILQRGFMDGPVGLRYHYLHALWYRTRVDLELLSLSRAGRSGAGSP